MEQPRTGRTTGVSRTGVTWGLGRDVAQGARFNAGNTHFARKNWPDAIRNYQEALRLDPADRDAKKNLELALLQMQEEEKKKQEQKQDDKQDDQQDEKRSAAAHYRLFHQTRTPTAMNASGMISSASQKIRELWSSVS